MLESGTNKVKKKVRDDQHLLVQAAALGLPVVLAVLWLRWLQGTLVGTARPASQQLHLNSGSEQRSDRKQPFDEVAVNSEDIFIKLGLPIAINDEAVVCKAMHTVTYEHYAWGMARQPLCNYGGLIRLLHGGDQTQSWRCSTAPIQDHTFCRPAPFML